VGPNGPDRIWGSFRRCRPGTSTRLRGWVARPVLGAVERKVASRSGLLPKWRADAHLRTDPQLAKTSSGEQRAHVSPIRMPRSDRACRSESKLPEGHLEPFLSRPPYRARRVRPAMASVPQIPPRAGFVQPRLRPRLRERPGFAFAELLLLELGDATRNFLLPV
jgi:hypothetical protein